MTNLQRKRKVNWKRVVLLAAIPVVLIAGGFGAYKIFFQDPYAQYTAYNEDSKQSGSMKHETKDEESYYLSVYYPSYGEDVLDAAIQQYTAGIKTDLKQNSKIIISVDYDSADIFDSYTSITFHQKLYDENGKVLKDEATSFNYDKKAKKMMSVQDVLRRDYISLVRSLAGNANIDEKTITTANLANFSMDEKSVSFYLNNDFDKKITVNYADHKEYIAMTNKNIPSLYQQDEIVPAAQAKIDPDKPMVAFTFDDGPSDLTTQLMDAFDKYDAKATFFMVGPNVERRSDVVADMYKRGFELGNHTWSHAVELTRLSKDELYTEIYKTQDAIFKACGKDAAFLRAPYGSYNEDVLKASTMAHAFWSIDTEDWKNRNTDAVKNEILANLHDGAIILEHDLYGTSVEAAIEMLPILKEKGYQVVTLSTLMKYKGDTLSKYNFVTPSLYE